MALAALDPFANAASKAPRTAAFDYINPGGLPSAVLGLSTHIAAIKDLTGA